MTEHADRSVAEQIEYRRNNAVDPEDFLFEAEAIEFDTVDDDLTLTDEFLEAVEAEIETLLDRGHSSADVARLFSAREAETHVADREYLAYKTGDIVRNWPSEEALYFDLAVDGALRESHADWEAVPPRQRQRIVQSLRTFQDECPFCAGTVGVSNDKVESCCDENLVHVIHCTGCETRFFEFSPGSVPV
ncbi:hypothetical protein J2751_001309 [Halorubrum alkaliphilum]|uniref:Uncharacterized protein n=1 Tax=Halorubrum alkaliphilum TaxID=261290 RepID=A0A8T4GFS4_9EURY|nr:hypothetical protein [Halorubrum alkaliphilum]MBP1922301.1 hypothetical protein [Halorubrum alkaliphilum]